MSDLSNTVPGLLYIPNYVAPAEEMRFLENIDADADRWLGSLERRVQHYGYLHDYFHNRPPEYIGPLVDWLRPFAIQLKEEELMNKIADQAIVNEYLPGQGISKHVDSTHYGPDIAILTVNSTCTMRFRNKTNGETVENFLERCSLLVLGGEARKSWTHEIPMRKSDNWGGMRRPRGRRLSVTLRTVLAG